MRPSVGGEKAATVGSLGVEEDEASSEYEYGDGFCGVDMCCCSNHERSSSVAGESPC